MSTDIQPFSEQPLQDRINYARTLAGAGDLIPSGLREAGKPSPGKILLVAETGSMLGIHPVAALQGVNVIDGKPTLSPALMSALVRKAGHTLRVATSGQIKDKTFTATATLIRRDDPRNPFVVTWGFERAERAGLVGKGAWGKYPEAMFKARAISEVCREGAQDVFLGAAYTPEELGANVDSEGQFTAPPEPARSPARKAEPEPDVLDVQPEPTLDWVSLVDGAGSVEQLRALDQEAVASGEGGLTLPTGDTVRGYIRRHANELKAADDAAQAAEVAEGGDE